MSVIKVRQGLFSMNQTITAGFQSANNHDHIMIGQGTYNENIEIDKGITIQSENKQATINGQIIIDSNEEVHLKNLNIHTDAVQQLIYVRKGKLLISNCTISGATGNSIYVEEGASLVMENCHVTENIYGIAVYGEAEIKNSMIEKTSAQSDQIFAAKNGTLHLSHTKIQAGRSVGVSFIDHSSGHLTNCEIKKNEGVNLFIDTTEEIDVIDTKIDHSKSNGISVTQAKVALNGVEFRGNDFPQLCVLRDGQVEADHCKILSGSTNAILVQDKGILSLKNSHIEQHEKIAVFVKDGHAHIENCYLSSSKVNAIYCEDAVIKLTGTKIEGYEEIQIRSFSSELTIENSEITDGKKGNVLITRGSAVIKDSKILRATDTGLTIEQKANVKIIDSNISDNQKNGVGAYTKSSLHITNTHLSQNNYPQVFASDVTDLNIEGTEIKDGAGNGISLYGGTKAKIFNTTVSAHLKYPQIYMQENTILLLQESHVQKGNSSGIYLKDHASVTIEDSVFSENNIQVDIDSEVVSTLRRVRFIDGITNIRARQDSISLEDCEFDDGNAHIEVPKNQVDQGKEQPLKVPVTNGNLSVNYENVMEELNSYIGLHTVKSHIKKISNNITLMKYKLAQGLASEQPVAPHLVFQGNPGTGKTSIARLIGKLYKSLGLLEKGHVVEANREDLVGPFIGQTEDRTKLKIEEALDGVLFIDEAYSLVRSDSPNDFGYEVITTLIPALENYRGRLSVIIAGYSEEMDEFIKSNPGLPSRFNERLHFEDYTPEEMLAIFKRFTEGQAQVLTQDAENLLADIFTDLYRGRDKYFANARLVRNKSEDVTEALSHRVMSIPQESWSTALVITITEEDIMAVFPGAKRRTATGTIHEESLKEALTELDQLIGLEPFKKNINNLIKHVRYREAQGEDITNLLSHTVLFGSPGTGKTVAARILAKIYGALGLLKKGHLVEVGRDDFIAPYIGQTEEKTAKVLEKAHGGILFIDEAYALTKENSTQDYGKEAIEMLLSAMENNRGDFVIIAAGYTEEMIQFLRANPGLNSRFANKVHFEDYTPDELLAIFEQFALQANYRFETGVLPVVEQHLIDVYRKRDRSFGNARLVRTIFQRISTHCATRVIDAFEKGESLERHLITLTDVEKTIGITKRTSYDMPINEELLAEWLEKLNRLIGLENVKKDIQDTVDLIRYYKKEGREFSDLIDHTILLGNPGTGKTEVGRILAGIYEALGILERGDLIEVDRTALVDQFRGGTEAKTRRLIEYAHQCTLFIDEAYTLTNKDSYDVGHTAIEVLLKQMSDKEGQFMVIAAGYEREMEDFINSNPGLSRRFRKRLSFEDYTAPELLEIADLYLEDYQLTKEARTRLLHHLKVAYMKRDRTFGNASFAKTIIEGSKRNLDLRMSRLEDGAADKRLITEMDLEL